VAYRSKVFNEVLDGGLDLLAVERREPTCRLH
jgi:hypothetical protein